ncbi:HesA/MoeB/ThiF family protein [Alkaliphilus oremlandii]|uniref:UBA/THIF-type NAD/FAD binding protein n=1 Tax=Alkaliphilus oremlandii (strain OhILAs) TaxID=350688 RepID=A8MGD9_ALKOO|nr:ThiF family adenylyltransferase [Alkaliphilus oremlandii]ABW18867.1 UBA/THIF-type NAD/FAD binding protein [Alkaliphilus oremlandii OhILAs]
MNKPKLRSSVSVVKLDDRLIEFFLTNTRQQVRVKVNSDKVLELILGLDGTKSIDEIIENYKMDEETSKYFISFINFLESKGIVKDNTDVLLDDYFKFRRIINFIEDFSSNKEDVLEMWNNIRDSKVVVIGLGAVGTWVSALLVQNGVGNITLIDNDLVEISNLHRQFGYGEDDVGLLKTDALEKRLREFSSDVRINTVNEFLEEDNLEKILDYKVDLIINCADKPSVDVTSTWVGEYCMKYNIPHIIGGGYNLHISLMGQTIIPFESACVKCFEKELSRLNNIDESNIKKLTVKNRKIGSFGPMCSIIASMTAMEGIKLLTKKITPANLNRRGEFSIYNMDINYHYVSKDEECSWCGKEGIYA